MLDDTPTRDPLDISCRYYYYKPMAAFFNAFHLRSYQAAGIRLEEPILDVGCSTGTFGIVLEETLRPIPRMTGIDLSAKSIEVARKIAGNCYKELFVGDATRLPFETGSFQTILSNVSMTSFSSGVDKATGEMYRVLKRGGRVYATMATDLFEKNYLFAGMFRAMGLKRLADLSTAAMNRRLTHYSYSFTANQWKEVFESQGFSVEQMSGFLPVSELRMWGFLAWTPMRAHGMLQYVPSTWVRKAVAKFYKKVFSARYARAPASLNPHESACILLEASKR